MAGLFRQKNSQPEITGLQAVMDLSVIILTWNSEPYLESCLNSLMSALAGRELAYEVLIVDNGSKDRTPELLRRFADNNPDRVTLLFMTSNLGTTVSRNQALSRARGTYLCIMDSDVEAGPEAFSLLIGMLQDNPTIGLTVPQIRYPTGNWQKSVDRFPTLAHKINRFFNLRMMESREGESLRQTTGIRDVEYAISAFWIFRRELLAKVGFLDEKIFYSPEDVDYCLRVWKAGYRVVYVPSAIVIHHTQEISRGWKLNRAKFSHLKGLLYLFAKHRYLFAGPEYPSLREPTREEGR
jgi:GT2 family glycosyltransferase